MHNMVYLIGRLENDIKAEGEIGTFNIKVQCPDGHEEDTEKVIYKTLTFKVQVTGQMTEHCKEYIHTGDLVGLKGQLDRDENDDIFVRVERISFLASAKSKEEN